MNLGKKLRHMRQARGLTAVELAQRARVTTGFISQLEHSQTVPSLQTLQRIAAVLGVSMTYFFLEEYLQPQVVRKQERPIIHLGHDGSCVSLLSPLPTRHLELALCALRPGRCRGPRRARMPASSAICSCTARSALTTGTTPTTWKRGTVSCGRGRCPIAWRTSAPNDARLLIATAPASLWQQAAEEASSGTAAPAPADSLSA